MWNPGMVACAFDSQLPGSLRLKDCELETRVGNKASPCLKKGSMWAKSRNGPVLSLRSSFREVVCSVLFSDMLGEVRGLQTRHASDYFVTCTTNLRINYMESKSEV